ncbi:MAG: ATP-binding cassette domain-containing protein [Propioniciclava sp.]|uniref:ABC transporter ATP-binding protein n=1 Tax=Propioniciclava sp. TaxID=2038686 RepID=UPI0039E2908F
MTSPTDQAWAIRTRDLRKTYQRGTVVAVGGLDLAIPRGGVHGFLGPNGSGKTTTLRMLLGLARPDSGTMELLGEPVPERLAEVIDRVGAIVESPKFFASMSGRKNLALLAQGIGVPLNRVGEVLEQVGLAARGKDLAGRYSLGMKQRLAIAATLLKDPELLIFDEPTNGLDPAGIHEVRTTMRALADQGKTVVVSSHILAEVQQVADTVSIIARGRLLRSGTVAELLAGGASRVRVRVADTDAAARLLLAASYEVQPHSDGALMVRCPGQPTAPEEVARLLGEAGIWPSELGLMADNLEQVFLDLTRDEHLGATQFMPQGRSHTDGGAA